MKILVNGIGYPEKRNIILDAHNDYINVKKKNIYFYINAVRKKILHKNKKFIFRFIPGTSPEGEYIIHLFNEVAHSPVKWLSTFETEIPRVLPVNGIKKMENPELHRLMSLLAAPKCICLIAISECTSKIQMNLLDHFPDYRDSIGRKIFVMHPPQHIINDKKRLPPNGKVRFTFIGNEFFRKGGAEVVLAFSELFEERLISNDDVEVTLIGDLSRKHNIALRDFQDNPQFHLKVEGFIRKHEFFHHSDFIPNDRVIELLKNTDVGLLPTWQDTYGFSVLEMQACGCPVITTNVRALPEINPPSAGWMIECNLNEVYENTVDSEASKESIRSSIISQLKIYILDALNNREGINFRSVNSLERIRNEHNPNDFNEKLTKIYSSAKNIII